MRPFVYFVLLIFISTAPISNVFGQAEPEASREEAERLLEEKELFSDPRSTEAVHQQIVFASPQAESLGRTGLNFIETQIFEAAHRPPEPIRGFGGAGNGTGNDSIPLLVPPAASRPPSYRPPLRVRACPTSKYRRYNGFCNNKQHPNWGQSFRAYNRLLRPQYADGISAPRRSLSDHSALPSTRLVSSTVLGNNVVEFSNVSVLFSFFGQFLSHDLSQTPAAPLVLKSGKTISCCQAIANNISHPDCFVIDIPASDAFYSQFNETCMQFARSLPAPPSNDVEVREQMNQLTAYLDASQIYGSLGDKAQALRANHSGKLNVSIGSPGRDFPPNLDTALCVGNLEEKKFCFQAGDVRSAETPQLATLHVLFLREHNRLADELTSLNPGWTSETVFQEARKIVIAELQHITYSEFLPIVLGESLTRSYDLQIHRQGFWNNYDNHTDATIVNEFATAAFRYGHSNIPSMVQLYSGDQNTLNQRLRDHFMQPYDGKLFNDYVGGLANQASMVTDNEVSNELTEHLFQRGNRTFGLDLPALTMQRGRDHAIGTYTQARQFCGLPDVNSFDDLNQHMYPDASDRLASIYKHVEDVDLWIGGVSEISLPDAVVGPTFACIIGEQFKRTRKGDRFWYERGGPEAVFTEAQLEQIKLSSMSRIICDNSDILEIQPLAFLKQSIGNSKVSCDEIPKPIVEPWNITDYGQPPF